jgi:hypothetical protein
MKPSRWSYRKIGNWWGRKFLGLIFVAGLAVIAGRFSADKVASIEIALVGLYTAFVGGHTFSDIQSKKPAVAPCDKEHVKPKEDEEEGS